MLKVVRLLVAGTILIGSALPLVAAFVPPSLPVGSQYQLIFVTAGVRDATSTDIADYNSFVNAQAALNPSLPTTTWRAIGSTATVDANVNAPSGGLPVYNTQGIEIVSGATSLYSFNFITFDTLLNPIAYDQFGIESDTWVFTGAKYDGTRHADSYLGDVGVNAGYSMATTFGFWFDDDPFSYSSTDQLPFYALSDPITIVPEPGSIAMLGSGFLTVFLARYVHRKRRLNAAPANLARAINRNESRQ